MCGSPHSARSPSGVSLHPLSCGRPSRPHPLRTARRGQPLGTPQEKLVAFQAGLAINEAARRVQPLGTPQEAALDLHWRDPHHPADTVPRLPSRKDGRPVARGLRAGLDHHQAEEEDPARTIHLLAGHACHAMAAPRPSRPVAAAAILDDPLQESRLEPNGYG